MSLKYSLDKEDYKKIGIGAGVAVIGALLTYLTSVITNTNFGQWTPVVVTLWSVITNVVRKWIAGEQAVEVTPPPEL